MGAPSGQRKGPIIWKELIGPLYAIIRQAAESGARCPTNGELAERLGVKSMATIAETIRRLELQDDIEVLRFQCSRVVVFPDGKVTGGVPDWKDRRPHRPAGGPRPCKKPAETVLIEAATSLLAAPPPAPLPSVLSPEDADAAYWAEIDARPDPAPRPHMPDPRGCRWIEGDPPTGRWCDRKPRADSSYCDEHHRRTHGKTVEISHMLEGRQPGSAGPIGASLLPA